MKFILQTLAVIAFVFIRIGDGVLQLLTLLKKFIHFIIKSIKKSLHQVSKLRRQAFLRAKTLPHPTLSLTKRKTRKKKAIVVFPLPIWFKLRYFFVGTIFSFLFIFLPLLVLLFLQDLPHPTELTSRQIAQTTKIYDRNGTLLYEIYASQNRTLVPLSEIPKHLQQATLAIEDKNFYKHPGFDIAAIIRALRENSGGEIVQGGSTITQQLIKSSMLTPEQSIERKVKEVVLAFWAERMYSKEQILEMYFNQVPYGGTAWGIEAAADVYFSKHVKDLTLAESAFLAGITAAPTAYSPYTDDQTLWKARQKEVLSRMVAVGFINKKQADEALSQELTFTTPQIAFNAPHFVNYIKNYLIQKYGLAAVEKGGLKVITSLDLSLNKSVQEIVADEVNKAEPLSVSNGAALVTNPKNGDILAMIGSRDFNDANGGNVNLTTSHRQPGSTVKTITYATALSNGFTPATILDDSPQSFPSAGGPTYSPVNYDGTYKGKIPLRLALANSLNLPAVKVLQQVGVSEMVHLGKQLGISSWNEDGDYGLAITLGAAEVTMIDMATVNGTYANMGERVNLNPILKITSSQGQVLEEKKTVTGQRVLQEGVAYILSDILADGAARSLAFGQNSPLTIPGHTVSVKTGTSDNKRDNWTIGYTPDFVVTVWVGNNDNSPMSPTLASGITGAAPIWHRIMTQLLEKTPDKKYAQPEDVVSIPCNGKKEYFLKGTEQGARCAFRLSPTTPSR